MNIQKREISILLPVIFLANLFSLIFLGNTQHVYAIGQSSPIISGVVIAKEDATVIIRDGMARTAVEIPNDVPIRRNNLVMEVVSGGVVQFGKMLIPLTFGGIAALVLSMILSRKLREYAQKFGSVHQPGMTSA